MGRSWLHAPRIIDNGGIDAARIDGALGWVPWVCTQFLPPCFWVVCGVDADGDGRRDILGLHGRRRGLYRQSGITSSGWNMNTSLGPLLEVSLPASFDYAPFQAFTASEQQRLGQRRCTAEHDNGQALPSMAGRRQHPSHLRVRAATRLHGGQTYSRAVLRYNSSTGYALGVACCLMRLAGNGGVIADWPQGSWPAVARADPRWQNSSEPARVFSAGTRSISGDGPRSPCRACGSDSAKARAGCRRLPHARAAAAPAAGYHIVRACTRG